MAVRRTLAFSLVTSPAIWWRSVEIQRGSVTFAGDVLTLLKCSIRLFIVTIAWTVLDNWNLISWEGEGCLIGRHCIPFRLTWPTGQYSPLVWNTGGFITTENNRRPRRKPVPLLHCPPHIRHDVARVRTQQPPTEDVAVTLQTLKDCSNFSIYPLPALD